MASGASGTMDGSAVSGWAGERGRRSSEELRAEAAGNAKVLEAIAEERNNYKIQVRKGWFGVMKTFPEQLDARVTSKLVLLELRGTH